jgi:hypothetical protein
MKTEFDNFLLQGAGVGCTFVMSLFEEVCHHLNITYDFLVGFADFQTAPDLFDRL